MAPKSSFGHPGVWFLRSWEGLIEVLFLMSFLAALEIRKFWKKEAGCEKIISVGRVGGRPRVPGELLEFAKSKESVRVCNEFQTPCPLRAGAADCYPFGSSADPIFVRRRASDLRGFVKQPSFDIFYQNRPTMAPHSANNGTNLAQREVKGYPEINKNIKKQTTKTNANANKTA